ncbi:MAG: hypothetical protein R3A10_12310 [Caldilineaceae bacterium]
MLSPNEVWIYQATGTALDLGNPPADDALVLVTDVCTKATPRHRRARPTPMSAR